MHLRLPRWLARANRVVANPVMRLWAPYLPPWAIIAHRGRRTGSAYRTVVLAFRRDDTLVIAMIYGESDWQRNILAADGAEVTRLGRSHDITNPRVIDARHARELPAGTRWTARAFGSAFVADIG